MLQQVSEPLRPGDGCCPGSGGKFLRIDPLGEFRQNRRHLTESARVMRVTDEIQRRCLGRRHEERAPRCTEVLNGHLVRRFIRAGINWSAGRQASERYTGEFSEAL